MIVTRGDEYDSTTDRGGKAAIAQELVEQIQQKGGRFLKLDETTDWWLPVSDKEAKSKVCQGFRKKREKDLATGSRVRSSSTTTKAMEHCNKVQVVEKSSGTNGLIIAGTFEEVEGYDESHIYHARFWQTLDSPIPDTGPFIAPEDPAPDILNAEELAYMLEGSPPEPDVPQQASDPVICDNPEQEENIDQSIFDDPTHLFGINNDDEPMTQQEEKESCDEEPLKQHQDHGLFDMDVTKLLSVLTGNDGTGDESKPEDPLLAFLESRRDSLKCSPQESYDWLRNQDIVTMSDLREACLDNDFLELEFKQKGGLKGFKRRPFVNAVISATSGN
jgi:hypothetical protein